MAELKNKVRVVKAIESITLLIKLKDYIKKKPNHRPFCKEHKDS